MAESASGAGKTHWQRRWCKCPKLDVDAPCRLRHDDADGGWFCRKCSTAAAVVVAAAAAGGRRGQQCGRRGWWVHVDSALCCLNCRSSPICPKGLVVLLHYRLNNRRGIGSIAPIMPSVQLEPLKQRSGQQPWFDRSIDREVFCVVHLPLALLLSLLVMWRCQRTKNRSVYHDKKYVCILCFTYRH